MSDNIYTFPMGPDGENGDGDDSEFGAAALPDYTEPARTPLVNLPSPVTSPPSVMASVTPYLPWIALALSGAALYLILTRD